MEKTNLGFIHTGFQKDGSCLSATFVLPKTSGGVATFVQGTVLLGDLGSSGQMSKGQLSKKILVQGNFCPRKVLPMISLLKLFFLYFIGYNDID